MHDGSMDTGNVKIGATNTNNELEVLGGIYSVSGVNANAGYFIDDYRTVALGDGYNAGYFYDGTKYASIVTSSVAGEFGSGTDFNAYLGTSSSAGYFTDETNQVILANGFSAGYFEDGINHVTLANGDSAGYFEDGTNQVTLANGFGIYLGGHDYWSTTELVSTKFHTDTVDPKLMVYTAVTREEVLILETDVKKDFKGMSIYFNKDTGKMENWNTLTGEITNNKGEVISHMNTLGSIKKGYYLNYTDNNYYKIVTKNISFDNGTKEIDLNKITKSNLFENIIVNTTEMLKTTCYKADTKINDIVSYNCTKQVINGTHAVSSLKKGITISDDGKVFETIKSSRPVTDYTVRVNLAEALE
jgi:hypothetical protein